MSVLWELKRWVDRVQYERTREELRRQREAHPDDATPDELDLVVPPAKDVHARFRCRVCAYEGGDGAYCPECLAGTMVAVKPEE